ncbi:hypothetical protein RND81_14G245500 [Saponaria officinalis]|uniref:F-box domain-containing protein n=1 Tax=Saponaria officinalis TaxID=3572 RepID=A0AAW1GTE6_SAPOF
MTEVCVENPNFLSEVRASMDILSSQIIKDRISELPDEILVDCLSLLDMKSAAQTSIISRRWRYLWTHLSTLDFDPDLMYPQEFETFWKNEEYETSKYFGWINQVVSVHRGTSIDKFIVHSRYVTSYATLFDKWVKFALSKRAKELVLDLMGINLICKDHSEKGYPLGFDTLRHPPCYTGITAIQSLHLHYVNVSDEFLEFLMSHCHHLERLYLQAIPLSNLKVKSSKLKYLSIIMCFSDLEKLEIDAENLLYFLYDDAKHESGLRMVFRSVPRLVETVFRGGLCQFPFPIFEKLSLFSGQLCKLSLDIDLDWKTYENDLAIPEGVIPSFPNLKHFTCTTICYDSSCILALKRFIEACPTLEEFKMQIMYMQKDGFCEAIVLREIDLDENLQPEINFSSDHDMEIGHVPDTVIGNMNEEKSSHRNLRILEVVGFLGVECDTRLILAITNYACSLKTVICDPQGIRYSHTPFNNFMDAPNEYDAAKRRARKLAKIVEPKVKVVVI